MKSILNIGCGKTRIPGSIGVDRVLIDGFVDVIHDLEVTPYPFDDGTVDEIHLYHVLEHLHEPLRKIEELHRILKPGGILYMRVPHFSSLGAFTDITHRRPFGYGSFDCLEPDHAQHYYTTASFRIERRKIKYFGLYPNEGVYERYFHPNQCFLPVRPLVRLINACIAVSPTLFERVWCYWVGGACEIEVELRKV